MFLDELWEQWIRRLAVYWLSTDLHRETERMLAKFALALGLSECLVRYSQSLSIDN